MKRTIRRRVPFVVLNAATRQKLVYKLTKKGPGAVFVMTSTDSGDEPIFSMDDLGGGLKPEYQWELRTRIESTAGAPSEAVFTFSRSDGTPLGTHEFRTSDPAAFEIYRLVMSFMFLGTYTLVVDHRQAGGALIQTLVDEDFTGDSNTDTANSGITVQVGGL
jgi:hypothetical protein